MTQYKTPYEILGIPSGSSVQEIKAAYRRLSLQHHPDLCAEHLRPAAEKYFKEVTAAYTTLTQRGSTPSSSYQHTSSSWHSHHQRSRAPTPGRYSNGVVGAIIAAPLVLLGIWLQHKSKTINYDEMSHRPHGLLSPPVNPYLHEDWKPKTYSRFWGQSSKNTYLGRGQAGVKQVHHVDSNKGMEECKKS